MSYLSGDAPRVGPELRLDSAQLIADPYPVFARERADAPVRWSEVAGCWMALSRASADAVLRARTMGRVWTLRWPEDPLPMFAMLHENALLENEPPRHTRLRRLIATAFSRGHVERLDDWVAGLAEQLADQLADAGSDGSPVDILALFAEPLPVNVIGELLGVPAQDRRLLRPWSAAMVKLYEPAVSPAQRSAAERASTEFAGYLRELVAARRAEPRDDLITSLAQETDGDGQRLSEDELIATGVLLLNAGHEATVNTIGNGMHALLGAPAELAAVRAGLADDAVLGAAVEEMIRFDSPLQLFERTAFADTVIGEALIRPGERIAALLGAANRDPAAFDRPDRFDAGRTDNPHLGFGAGIHYCVGAPLARLELRAALRTLLRRFPALAPAGDPPRRPEFVLRGFAQLPVVLR